ncbi:MAG: tetratricopeptide repeat protein [Polyangiaceae bacterium]
MTRLFGREAELERGLRLVADGHAVIAIAGPPGIGRARFAAALAERATRAKFVVRVSPADAHATRDGADAATAAIHLAPLSTSATTELLAARCRALGVDVDATSLARIARATRGFSGLVELAARGLRTLDGAALAARLERAPLTELTRDAELSAEYRDALTGLSASARSLAEHLALCPCGASAEVCDQLMGSASAESPSEATRRAHEELLDGSIAWRREPGRAVFEIHAPFAWILEGDARARRELSALEDAFARVVLSAARPTAPDLERRPGGTAAICGGPPGWSSTDDLEAVAIRFSEREAPEERATAVRAACAAAAQGAASDALLAAFERLASHRLTPNEIAAVAVGRATALRARDRVTEALSALEPAVRPAPAAPLPDLEVAHALELECALLRRLRRFEDAQRAGEAALRRYERLGSDGRLRALGALGALSLEAGELDEAQARFEVIARSAGSDSEGPEPPSRFSEILAGGFLGHVASERAQPTRAAELYARASRDFAGLDDERLSAIYEGYEGTAREESAEIALAIERYASAAARLAAVGAAGFSALFAAYEHACKCEAGPTRVVDPSPSQPNTGDRGHDAAIALCHARASLASGAPIEPASLTATFAAADVSDDVRFALRRLSRSLAERRPSHGGPRLQLGGGLAVLDEGPPIDLRPRRVLWRLLERLAAQHLVSPGVGPADEVLLRAAWGSEKVLPAAAAHRLRVAVSELRAKGLASVLGREARAYRFSSDLEIRFAPHCVGGESSPPRN